MKFRSYIVLLIPVLLVYACKPKLDGDVEMNAGELNLSRVIYTGDYLLSGYTNGGLYRDGQATSIPAIISTQFELVGGALVSQPLMPSGGGTGYLKMDTYNSNGSYTTVQEAASAQIGSATVISPYCISDSLQFIYQNASGGITNYSFPELRVGELTLSGIGNTTASWFNPYFARISPGDNSYINEINAESPTFFICAFGLSDVLAKVNKGWGCEEVTGETAFKDNYRKLLSSLTSKTSAGLLIEVPSIDKLPFLNVTYAPSQTVYIEAKQNYVDQYEIRAYQGEDHFFRSSLGKIGIDGYGLSDSVPIQSEDIIDRWEKFQIAADIDKYNQAINELAAEFNLPVVSMDNYLLAEKGLLGDSLIFNGTHLQVNDKQGSAVSLDGLFPSPRGAAAIANKCIQQINAFYSAKIPLADINNYPGVVIP